MAENLLHALDWPSETATRALLGRAPQPLETLNASTNDSSSSSTSSSSSISTTSRRVEPCDLLVALTHALAALQRLDIVVNDDANDTITESKVDAVDVATASVDIDHRSDTIDDKIGVGAQGSDDVDSAVNADESFNNNDDDGDDDDNDDTCARDVASAERRMSEASRVPWPLAPFWTPVCFKFMYKKKPKKKIF